MVLPVGSSQCEQLVQSQNAVYCASVWLRVARIAGIQHVVVGGKRKE
jgi:hypothetical protein